MLKTLSDNFIKFLNAAMSLVLELLPTHFCLEKMSQNGLPASKILVKVTRLVFIIAKEASYLVLRLVKPLFKRTLHLKDTVHLTSL